MAIIDTLRGVTATEDDDYFTNTTLVYYVNQAQLQVTSLATRREQNQGQSFRALDDLRSTQTDNPSGFTQVDVYYEGNNPLPNDFLDWSYLRYNNTPLKELERGKQYLLTHGNAIPNVKEGYFSVGNDEFDLFIHEDPDGSTDELIIDYIKTPTDITEASESLTELPDQLTGAVIYKAATLLTMQEMGENAKNFQQIFNQELQANLY